MLEETKHVPFGSLKVCIFPREPLAVLSFHFLGPYFDPDRSALIWSLLLVLNRNVVI